MAGRLLRTPPGIGALVRPLSARTRDLWTRGAPTSASRSGQPSQTRSPQHRDTVLHRGQALVDLGNPLDELCMACGQSGFLPGAEVDLVHGLIDETSAEQGHACVSEGERLIGQGAGESGEGASQLRLYEGQCLHDFCLLRLEDPVAEQWRQVPSGCAAPLHLLGDTPPGLGLALRSSTIFDHAASRKWPASVALQGLLYCVLQALLLNHNGLGRGGRGLQCALRARAEHDLRVYARRHQCALEVLQDPIRHGRGSIVEGAEDEFPHNGVGTEDLEMLRE
mmetsp:Transcript_51983/g.111225  ORF Transcript_51983/g.111225 Transcript_51983/m.111225 type:complete len:280 (+) Transcript_51983:60-899(+)